MILKSNAKNTSHIFYANEIILYTVIVLAKKGELMEGKKNGRKFSFEIEIFLFFSVIIIIILLPPPSILYSMNADEVEISDVAK